MEDFLTLANPGVRTLKPYVPGKPIEAVEREYGVQNVIKLASNENPLGPSPKALSAIQDTLKNLALYPDATGYSLKEGLSQHLKIRPEQIVLGNGSNDIFDLVLKTFVLPNQEVIIAQYAFIAFTVLSNAASTKIVQVPAQNFGHDLTAMAKAITSNTRLIFIANPNNPTGTWNTKTEFVQFMEQVPPSVLVLVDEAYFEYANAASLPQSLDALEFLHQYPNLIVTRTFSKAYGLAGIRVGFGVMHEALAEIINRVRQPFNVNSLGLIGASAALTDSDHLQKTLALNQIGYAQWTHFLKKHKIEYIPSCANFITIDTQQETTPLYQALLKKGVILRPLHPYGMPNHLRITLGLETENERCMMELFEHL